MSTEGIATLNFEPEVNDTADEVKVQPRVIHINTANSDFVNSIIEGINSYAARILRRRRYKRGNGWRTKLSNRALISIDFDKEGILDRRFAKKIKVEEERRNEANRKAREKTQGRTALF